MPPSPSLNISPEVSLRRMLEQESRSCRHPLFFRPRGSTPPKEAYRIDETTTIDSRYLALFPPRSFLSSLPPRGLPVETTDRPPRPGLFLPELPAFYVFSLLSLNRFCEGNTQRAGFPDGFAIDLWTIIFANPRNLFLEEGPPSEIQNAFSSPTTRNPASKSPCTSPPSSFSDGDVVVRLDQ